jgi:hypothetical protein
MYRGSQVQAFGIEVRDGEFFSFRSFLFFSSIFLSVEISIIIPIEKLFAWLRSLIPGMPGSDTVSQQGASMHLFPLLDAL